jgi:hypothetical protein
MNGAPRLIRVGAPRQEEAMDENQLTATGPGPFYLSTAQRAAVRVLGSSLEVTLYASLPGKGSDL